MKYFKKKQLGKSTKESILEIFVTCLVFGDSNAYRIRRSVIPIYFVQLRLRP